MTLLRLHTFRPERTTTAPRPTTQAAIRQSAAAPAARPAPQQSNAAALNGVSPSATAKSASFARPPGSAVRSEALVSTAPTGEIGGGSTSNNDDGWHSMVASLPLAAMTKQLAQHCEMVSRTDAMIRLRLSPLRRSLLDKQRQDNLQAALQTHFGKPIRLEIEVAELASETPAQRATIAQIERQESATAAIKSDPFVREVVDLFGADIDESSIKPI